MTIPNSEVVALRDALATVEKIARNGEGCPPADELWESVMERLPKRKNEAVILHCVECAACAAAWRLARELVDGKTVAEQAPARDRPPYSFLTSRGWLGLAAAAAVIILAVVGVQRVREPASVPVYRAPPETGITSEIAGGVTLPRDACILRWSPGPPGTIYDVRVTTSRLQPLARAWALEQPEYRIDPGALEGMAPGATILWRVTAYFPDGREVVSPTFDTQVE